MYDQLVKVAEEAIDRILLDPESPHASVVSAAKEALEREEGKITVDNSLKTILEEMPVKHRGIVIVPKMLDIAGIILDLIYTLNQYKFILLEGGRGSSKTQTAARLILLLCELRCIRAVCGRELETNIEESVHAVFADLIRQYNLNFTVQKTRIIHNTNGSEILFMGMKEATSTNLKGLEGADLVWMDEAETATEPLLRVLIPTLRKNKVLFIFTMNRRNRDDAVVAYLEGRSDCYHRRVNYVDNPHCPQTLIDEANECKLRNEAEWRHVWMGEPREETSDHIFNYQALWDSVDRVPRSLTGTNLKPQRVMSLDVAGGGGDKCVCLVMERSGTSEFTIIAMETWAEKDTMSSLGRAISFIAQFKPDVFIVDADGMGYTFCDRLGEARVPHYRYNGGGTQGIDELNNINIRAQAYFTAAMWFEQGWLCVPTQFKRVLSQLEKVKRKYRSDGRNQVIDKPSMRKDLQGKSPDEADALIMAIWAAIKYLRIDSYVGTEYSGRAQPIKLIDGSIRRHTWR